MKNKNLFAVSVLFFFAIILAACGAPATSSTVNVNTKPADIKPAATAASTTPAPTSTTPKTDASGTKLASDDSIGVPECDDFIEKYKACMTRAAAKLPAVEGPMRTAFEQKRLGFKKGAETPAGKASLARICKLEVDNAKPATAAYGCIW